MTSSLRILHVMLGKGLGGIEAMFAHYANALQARDHHVINLMSEGAQIAASLKADSHTIFLPARSQYDPRNMLAVKRIITAHKPDIILAHGKRADRVLTYAQALLGKTTPHVELLHRARFHRLHRADLTIAVNQDIAQSFAQRHGVDVHIAVLPNFMMHVPQVASREALTKPPRIGFLGRLVPEKGLDLLLEAAGKLHQQGIEFSLHIGGDGPQKATLVQHAKTLGIDNMITWHGWVADTGAFYEQVDCLCVPSRHESFGLIIIEAFAHAIPVLATRTSGPKTIIHHGHDGWLCDSTSDALAKQLADIITHPATIHEAGKRALLRAPEYSAANIVPKMEAALRETIERFKYQSDV
ncbi:MAG: glycosyltransferase [Alphaproteobacteria bacterium]|nr:glycosyltransferase [Alphaproteobacteria bacterium]